MSDSGWEIVRHGSVAVHTSDEMRRKLQRATLSGKPLRVKLGMDPTAPDIHLGHSVVLRKMRQFQDLGHVGVLIIGDFTARIGDPSGRSKTRPVLSAEEIDRNAKTYLDQAGRILDTSPGKLEIRRNSEWLDAMGFADVLRLAGQYTLGQLLAREDFRNRHEGQEPIGLHELLYPLVQGWDSVNVRSDVELGGTDQTYNNLVGRDLQLNAGQEPQVVITMPLLRGLDGVKKMSKSLGNYIGVLDSPLDFYGKTMSIPDALLEEWYGLLTQIPAAEFRAAIAADPFKAKQALARAVGAVYHSADAMAQAAEAWHASFSSRAAGEAMDVHVPAEEIADGAIAAWKLAWLAHGREISKSEARRLVEGGAFEHDGRKITDPNAPIPATDGVEYRAGRHRAGPRVKQPLVARIRR